MLLRPTAKRLQFENPQESPPPPFNILTVKDINRKEFPLKMGEPIFRRNRNNFSVPVIRLLLALDTTPE